MKKRILALTLIVAGLPSCIKISASPFDTSQGADGLAGFLATLLLSSTSMLYVAVGDQGKSYTSSDGRTWTAQTGAGSTITFNAIAWNGSRFFAAGGNTAPQAVIYSSADGITWTNVFTSGTGTGATTFNDIAFTSGKLIAVGQINLSTALIRTSSDGATWSTGSGATANVMRIAGDGTNFMAVQQPGSGTVGAYKSSDGITFTAVNQPFATIGKPSIAGDLIFASSRFIFAGSDDSTSATPPSRSSFTTDLGATTWTADSTNKIFAGNAAGEYARALAYNGTRLEAVGDNCRVDFTTNLTTLSWSSTALTMSGCSAINWKGMIWDGSKFVAVGSSGKFAASATGASTDWTYTTLGSSNVNAIAVR